MECRKTIAQRPFGTSIITNLNEPYTLGWVRPHRNEKKKENVNWKEVKVLPYGERRARWFGTERKGQSRNWGLRSWRWPGRRRCTRTAGVCQAACPGSPPEPWKRSPFSVQRSCLERCTRPARPTTETRHWPATRPAPKRRQSIQNFYSSFSFNRENKNVCLSFLLLRRRRRTSVVAEMFVTEAVPPTALGFYNDSLPGPAAARRCWTEAQPPFPPTKPTDGSEREAGHRQQPSIRASA